MSRSRLLFFVAAGFLLILGYHIYTSWSVHVQTVRLDSRLIGKTLGYRVVLPQRYSLITSRKNYPVLYLLHGWNGQSEDWIAQTKLTDYAARYQLIIVLPDVGNVWYSDSATVATDKYESYILQELIPDVESRFRAIRDRSGRAVAGLSMGGYGALKFGLKHPALFSVAASTSGALDAASRTDDESIMRAFGAANDPGRATNDLFTLAENLRDDQIAALPYFYFDCGADDPWLSVNRKLDTAFSERKIAHAYRELPGGHDWKYWDRQVQDILRVSAERLSPAQ